MPIIEGTTEQKWFVGEYDFAVDGGAIGQLTLRGGGALGGLIPAGTIILGGFIEVDTIVTSGGAATVSADSEAAGDLLAAAAVSGVPWSTTGRKNVLPAFSGTTSLKTTVARALKITIAAFTLTAGKFRVAVLAK